MFSSFWKIKIKTLIKDAPGNSDYERLKYASDYINELLKEKKDEEETYRAARQKEKERLEEIEKLKAELIKLHNLMVRDFNVNPYSDKYEIKNINGSIHFIYKFENGDTLQLDNDGILIHNSRVKYTLSWELKAKFILTANEIQKKGKARPKTNEWKDYFEKFSSERNRAKTGHIEYDEDYLEEFWDKFTEDWLKRNTGTYNSGSKGSQTNKNQSHPKWEVYQTIIITVNSRREQLSKLSYNHPDRPSLTNELNAAIKRMEEMQKKYNF